MNTRIDRQAIAFLAMRAGLGIVFLAFGIGKFSGDIWAETIKNMGFFMRLPWSTDISVFLIGASEVATGAALIIGLFTRFFASLAAIQLTGILILLRLGEIRDIGLLGAAVYLAAVDDDSFSIDRFVSGKKSKK